MANTDKTKRTPVALARDIRRRMRRVGRHTRRHRHATAIGRLLLQAKEQLPRGEYRSWLETTGLRSCHANRYMLVAQAVIDTEQRLDEEAAARPKIDGRVFSNFSAPDFPSLIERLAELTSHLFDYGQHQPQCNRRFHRRGFCTCGWSRGSR